MNEKMNREDMTAEKLMSAYYVYIGEHHLDNICRDIDCLKNEIDSIKVPASMETWFSRYAKNIRKKETGKIITRKLKSISKKAAIILLVLSASLFFITVSVEAIRIKVLNFFMEDHDKYTIIRIEENLIESGFSIGVEDYYFPSYLPDGFKIDSIDEEL